MPAQDDTIRVVIRCKGREPLKDSESAKWNCSETEIVLPEKKFTFDHILLESDQDTMYMSTAQETVLQFTKGFNGTIFAYGQSGSGKTFSMLGPEEVVDLIKTGNRISEDVQNLYGIIPRAIIDLFEYINHAVTQDKARFEVYINYFEIYMESLNNLLSGSKSASENLKIANNKVLNANPIAVSSPQEIFHLIQMGQNRVQTESTGMNDRSSRSHTILVLEYKQWNTDGSVKQAKLNLVDLAGSERIGKTGAKGKVLDEAKKINQSLSTLGRVIKALTDNDEHIPFRDSKLTHLLKESLGGNSKTTLICTISRKNIHFEESLQSLEFAGRVKKIKNKAVAHIQKSPQEMEIIIKKQTEQIFILKQQIKLIENGGTIPPGDISPVEKVEPKFVSKIGKGTKIGGGLKNNNDDSLQLIELQTEFEHYKSQKGEQIQELMDKVEKFEELEQEIIQYRNIDDSIKIKENQIQNMQYELDNLMEMYQQSQLQCNQKDSEIRELENQNDDLRAQMEQQSFDIFYTMQEKVAAEFESKNMQSIQEILKNDDKMKEVVDKNKQLLSKYSNQEEIIIKLSEEINQLKIKNNQLEFMHNDIEFRRISDSEMSPDKRKSITSSVNARDLFPEDESETEFTKDEGGITQYLNKLQEDNKSGLRHSVSRDSLFMKSMILNQREKLQPMLAQLNMKLSSVSLDNIRIIQQNNILLDIINQQKDELKESTHSEADHEEIIVGLKSKLMHLERDLKKEQFSKELLEKEIDKKKFKDKIENGDLKIQIKQLQINLANKTQEFEKLKTKVFDLQDEKKKLLSQNKDLKVEIEKSRNRKNLSSQMDMINQQSQVKTMPGTAPMITGKVNINSDFFSNKVFKTNSTSKMFAKVIFPVAEQDEEEKLDTTMNTENEKKPRIGLDHKEIMRASLVGSKDIPVIKKSMGGKASGLTKVNVDRTQKYKSKIQNVVQNLDDSMETDEDDKSSSSSSSSSKSD